MKQLYKVDMSTTVYVYANGHHEAAEVAECGVDNGDIDTEWEVNAKVANPIDVAVDEWGEAIPYGEDVDDRTCNDLLDLDKTKATS